MWGKINVVRVLVEQKALDKNVKNKWVFRCSAELKEECIQGWIDSCWMRLCSIQRTRQGAAKEGYRIVAQGLPSSLTILISSVFENGKFNMMGNNSSCGLMKRLAKFIRLNYFQGYYVSLYTEADHRSTPKCIISEHFPQDQLPSVSSLLNSIIPRFIWEMWQVAPGSVLVRVVCICRPFPFRQTGRGIRSTMECRGKGHQAVRYRKGSSPILISEKDETDFRVSRKLADKLQPRRRWSGKSCGRFCPRSSCLICSLMTTSSCSIIISEIEG